MKIAKSLQLHYSPSIENNTNTMDSPKLNNKAHLADAIQWIQDNLKEKPITAARIFHVTPNSIRMACKRAKRTDHKSNGGHNKILSDEQTEAIRRYC
jgi:hypothetical protein